MADVGLIFLDLPPITTIIKPACKLAQEKLKRDDVGDSIDGRRLWADGGRKSTFDWGFAASAALAIAGAISDKNWA